MRVVITGATGNVGHALVDRLLGDPVVTEVVGIARRRPDWTAEGLRWQELDLAGHDVSPDDVTAALTGADAVVHLAWAFQPTHQPEITWRVNTLGSRRVFEAAADAGVATLVHASSVGAYSPAPPDRRRVDESWPTDSWPSAAYGREKAYVERMLDAVELGHPEMRVVRLRPGFIFQKPAAHEQRRIFAGALLPGQLLAGRHVPLLPWPGDMTFQALHADDVAEAYRLALLDDVRGAFNVAAEPVMDADAMAELLGGPRVLRLPVAVLRGAMAAGWYAHLLPAEPALLDLAASLPTMDTTRARTELGWQERRSAADAVATFVTGVGEDDPELTPAMAEPTAAADDA